MRVLQIVADGSPGGGTTHVLQILRDPALSEEASLVTEPRSYLAGAAQAIGRECVEIDLFKAGQFLQAPRRLKRAIAALRPDLIHAHGSRAGFLTALANPGVPLVYTVHGLHILHRPATLRWLGIAAERITNQRANLTVFVSHADLNQALSHRLLPRSDRALVIPNGIHLPVTRRVREPAARHLGFVGRLETPKDPMLFLDVVERLPEFDATMVGWGALGPAVKQEADRRSLVRLRILGGLSHRETLDVMSRFTVLIVTSRWEAFGLAALEAMALGVPVVATKVGGLGEVIEDGMSGVLVSTRSADELANAASRLAEDACFRQQIIGAGQKRVREQFSEDRMLASIQQAYRMVMGARLRSS